MNLKNTISLLSNLLLLIVMILSGVGMLYTSHSWTETAYTCIWCLSLIIMTDKLDEAYKD